VTKERWPIKRTEIESVLFFQSFMAITSLYFMYQMYRASLEKYGRRTNLTDMLVPHKTGKRRRIGFLRFFRFFSGIADYNDA
jgi:hypothetical protein